MNRQSRLLLAIAPAALAAILALTLTVPAQAASKPPVPIRGCTTYLQMGDAQAKIISNDVARVAQICNERDHKISDQRMQQRMQQLREESLRLREERVRIREQQLQSGQQSPPSPNSPSTATETMGLSNEPPTMSPPDAFTREQMAAYEQQIIKIEVEIDAKRKILASIDRKYRRCIEEPPQSAEMDKPAAPTRKKRSKRAAESHAEPAQAAPRPGGHDPGAPSGMGIIGGGGVGIRF